jgi:hypothetical protein
VYYKLVLQPIVAAFASSEMEQEANDIVESVQNIFDTVTREFNAALEERKQQLAKDEEKRAKTGSSAAPRRLDWVGLDADGRARLAIESRKQVDRLKDIFDRVQEKIDRTDCGEYTAQEVQQAHLAVQAEIERRKRINAKLEALTKEAAILEEVAKRVDKTAVGGSEDRKR